MLGFNYNYTPMHQRKKNQNKDNFKTIKRTTLQQINYTQQLHVPTFATMDLRQVGRSIELKKTSSKKPASRKSRCISVKQNTQQPTLNLKQLLRQFKSMKLIQERSRSPNSSKSKQKHKKSGKLMGTTAPISKNNSEFNLTAKVEKTLKIIKNSQYFKDEDDSEIPLNSTSEAYTLEQKRKLEAMVNGQGFEDINIGEMRLFCKHSETGIRISLDYFKGNIYEMMARRIQRAWRRYLTQKLVCRYAQILMRTNSYQQYPEDSQQDSSSVRENIQICSEQLYPEEIIQRKVTYISNLEQESNQATDKNPQEQPRQQVREDNSQDGQDEEAEHSGNSDDNEALVQIKKEQLEKWSEIVALLHSNKGQNVLQTQQLYQQLISKVQSNKKSLELGPVSSHKVQPAQHQQQSKQQEEPNQDQYNLQKYNFKKRLQFDEDGQKRKTRQQQSSVSEDSIKQIEEQFNSKKYIEYLDGDMYPLNHHKQSFNTIGKQKQETLLAKLSSQDSARRAAAGARIVGAREVFQMEGQVKSRLSCRSNSDFSQSSSILAQDLKSSSRGSSRRESKLLSHQIKKSNSEKSFKLNTYEVAQTKKAINQLSQPLQQEFQQDMQIKIISNNPLTPVQKLNNPRQQIKSLLYETIGRDIEQDTQQMMRSELQGTDQDSQQLIGFQPNKVYLEDELNKQMAELQRLRDEDSDEEAGSKSQVDLEPVLQRTSKEKLQKVKIEDYEQHIESEEDNDDADIAQKGEEITQMIANTLTLELLVQMAKCPETILPKFKQMALKKPKIKRAPGKQKKNGFPTNQVEIKNFVEDLCTYVLNEQPQIFKNLQKSTGPSALEMLKYMHQSVDDDIYLDDQQDDPSVMVLPNWIFETLWGRKALAIRYERQGLDQQRQNQRSQYLKGLNKIFLRSCFDCLNECLDYERNFGPFGRPFPWKRTHQFQHVKSLEETRKSVLNAQKRLFQISSTYCGIMIQKQEIMSLCGNEDYVDQVQQDRLSRMLAQDLVQGQQRWIFYDDEETELLVEISNIIFYNMIQDAVALLSPDVSNLFI